MAVSKAPSPRPSPEHFDHLKWGAGTKTAMGAGSAVRISGLAVGQLYVITADAAWHFYQGPSASGAVSQATASTTDLPLTAYATKYIWISDASTAGDNTDADDTVSATMDSGTGNFFIAKVRLS